MKKKIVHAKNCPWLYLLLTIIVVRLPHNQVKGGRDSLLFVNQFRMCQSKLYRCSFF